MSAATPQFSIVIPCRNALTKLRATLDSIVAQSGSSFECIVIDAASTDGTRDWLAQSTEPNLQWVSEKDAGVYDAMNKGVMMARGHRVYFLGAGDLLLPGILSKAEAFLKTLDPGSLHFVYGNAQFRGSKGHIPRGRFNRWRLSWSNICHQAIFYDRAIFDAVGLYSLRYPIYSDWEFNLRCFGDERIRKIYWEEDIAIFEEAGLSATFADEQFGEDQLKLVRNHLGADAAVCLRMHSFCRRAARRLGSVITS